MKTADLKQLAVDIFEGKVFTSWMIRKQDFPNSVSMVFMPLIFAEKESLQDMTKQGIVELYEYMDKALPRSVNGYPCFMSFRGLKKEDCLALTKHMKKLEKAREKVMREPLLTRMKSRIR